jgi:hypothetical protein
MVGHAGDAASRNLEGHELSNDKAKKKKIERENS